MLSLLGCRDLLFVVDIVATSLQEDDIDKYNIESRCKGFNKKEICCREI